MGWFEDQAAELGIDPAQLNTAPEVARTTAGTPQVSQQAAQAGQWAPTNQGFLDWATHNNIGQNQGGFLKIDPSQFQSILQRYGQESGNQANFLGGPSGDRVDFGQGAQDALTSSGQIWNNESTGAGGPNGVVRPQTGGGSPFPGGAVDARGGGYNFGMLGNGGGQMPTAPTLDRLNAPAPFQAPGAPAPFQGGGSVPTMQQVGYTPYGAPASQQAQQVGTPAALSYQTLGNPQSVNYNPMTAPNAFQGSRLDTPQALSYASLATPTDFQYQDYKGLSPEAMAADPSYQFRLKQGEDALSNKLVAGGVGRTGNAAKALMDYNQGAASQEYAAADARARSTNAMNNAGQLGAHQTNAQTGLAYNQNNNANAFQFGQQNIANANQVNEANYGRASNEAQQGFQNQFATNQANNAGALNAAQANNASQLGFTNANNANALGFGQANIGNAFNATQANNANNLAYGAQNFNQGFATNQANNTGQFNATQANNTNALAAQNQQFNQGLGAYGANLSAQNQGFNQGLSAYNANAGNALNFGQANNANALNLYGQQSANALGLGNLGLGYQNSNNSYALGQGNLGLAQQGQQYNQDLSTFQTNYGTQVQDPWTRYLQLATLGNPSQNNGLVATQAGQGSSTIEGQGNANAAGQAVAGNAWANLAGNLGQYAKLYGGYR
jgi:hypothetical protein